MEFEDVSPEVVWEAARVAAAFAVAEWELTDEAIQESTNDYVGDLDKVVGDLRVGWLLSRDGQLEVVNVGSQYHGWCLLMWCNDRWTYEPVAPYDLLMARGLYRLGFEEEGVFTKLNHTFSAHEKLELRFSLPREFWPKPWLDEAQERELLNPRTISTSIII